MALQGVNNLFGEENIANIFGPQFEQDPTKLKLITHVASGVGFELAYTVPAGATLYVSKVIHYNNSGAGARTHGLRIDATVIYKMAVVAGPAKEEVDFPTPMALVAGTEIYVITTNIGSAVSFIGWEV